jgi:protoporphyrinogen IX oxidase
MPQRVRALRFQGMGWAIVTMYLLAKSLHIIAVISWMAGMLYLPRLYVYHAGVKTGSEASELFKVMERKLLRFIINPAMIASWVFGFWLASLYGWENLKHAGWFHVKLTMLVLMQICHAAFARWRRHFAQDRNIHTAKFYRIVNEVPTLLMIVIVLMVVIKPF